MAEGIWLEIVNVRMQGPSVEVQLKGDRSERDAGEPKWWGCRVEGPGEAATKSAREVYKTITDALDKKRPVCGWLAPAGKANKLEVDLIRVQFAESAMR